MKITVATCLILLAIIQSNGCTKREDRSVPLNEETVVRLHSDLMILSEKSLILKLDSAKIRQERDSLYSRVGMTEQEYEDAIAWYKADLDRWRDFNRKTVTRLEELQRAGNAGKDSVKGVR